MKADFLSLEVSFSIIVVYVAFYTYKIKMSFLRGEGGNDFFLSFFFFVLFFFLLKRWCFVYLMHTHKIDLRVRVLASLVCPIADCEMTINCNGGMLRKNRG